MRSSNFKIIYIMTTLINFVEKCLNLTDEYKSKITPEILTMSGMSGKKTRHFYNNIYVQWTMLYI